MLEEWIWSKRFDYCGFLFLVNLVVFLAEARCLKTQLAQRQVWVVKEQNKEVFEVDLNEERR